MRLQRATNIRLSFLALFSGGALLVLFWVTLESLFIKRLTFSYLLHFSLPATLVLLIGMIGILMLYVGLRLRKMDNTPADREEWICRSLLRLPSELFWVTIAYGGLFIPVYHIVHFLVEGNSLVRVEEYYWNNFIRSFLYEQTIALSAAILHYAVARRLIRPRLIKLTKVKGEQMSDKSFLSMLTATFAALLLVNLFSILWYVMVANIKDISIEFRVLGPLIMLDTAFAATIFILLTFEFRRELQVLIGSIRDWLKSNHSLHQSRMPILSHDEVGQLAMAFNGLQEQVHREYEELKIELQLARKVQLQLLPPARQMMGEYEIQALSHTRNAVGNGFYDIVPLKKGGFVAIAGGIKGTGIPAALQMSAALLLLRTEVEQETTPEEMLIGFRNGMKAVFPHEDSISLSLVYVDPRTGLLRAVVQGQMKIVRIRESQVEELASGAETTFERRDRLLLYSDQAAEAVNIIAQEHIGQNGPSQPLKMSLEIGLQTWINRSMNSTAVLDEDITLLQITRCDWEAGSE